MRQAGYATVEFQWPGRMAVRSVGAVTFSLMKGVNWWRRLDNYDMRPLNVPILYVNYNSTRL